MDVCKSPYLQSDVHLHSVTHTNTSVNAHVGARVWAGELLAEFAHRNITRLFGAVTEMPFVSLVMEYAAGGALNTALTEVHTHSGIMV